MPTKIIFETEDQAMEEVVETAAETKTLKVGRVSRVAGNRLNDPCGRGDVLPRLLHV